MTHVRPHFALLVLVLPILASCSRARDANLEIIPRAPRVGDVLTVIPDGLDGEPEADLAWTVQHNGTTLDATGYETRESWLRINSAESGSYSFTLAMVGSGDKSGRYTGQVVVPARSVASEALSAASPSQAVTYTSLNDPQNEEPDDAEDEAEGEKSGDDAEASNGDPNELPRSAPQAEGLAEQVWKIIEELDVHTIDVEFTETSQKLADGIKEVLSQPQDQGNNGEEFRQAVSNKIKPIVEALRGSGAEAWREFFSDFGRELTNRGFNDGNKGHMVSAYTELEQGLRRANDEREESVVKAIAYLMEKGYMPSGGGSGTSRSGTSSRRHRCWIFCRHCRE